MGIKMMTIRRGSEQNVCSETQLGQVFPTIMKLCSKFVRDEGREKHSQTPYL
jgi:hypothetical protein